MNVHPISFQTQNGQITLNLTPGSTVLVAGANGVGKSALLAILYRSLPQGSVTYLPGHRQINFNNGWEMIGQDAAQLRQNLFSQADHFSRFKGVWAEDQFKVTVRTLLHSEAAYNREFRELASQNIYKSEENASIKLSPVDTLNLIFKESRLPVRFILTNEGLSAQRETSVYAIDALSDGERAALFIASAIVVQASNSVILIDEPEKHLHPSITSLLVETSLRARPDISAVISSHDVDLIEHLPVSHIIHIRNSIVTSIKPEQRLFEAEVLCGENGIPEDLKKDLLGSRYELLFVEGESSSFDLALYSHVYEDIKISPRGGSDRVISSVKSLGGVSNRHWLKLYGLIDGDGRDAEERSTLEKQGVYVSPFPSIENIFFTERVIACFVEASTNYGDAESLEKRVERLAENCHITALKYRDEIIARRASWVLDRRLSASKLGPREVIRRNTDVISISIGDIISSVSLEVDSLIETRDWKLILQGLPIKNTGLLHDAAISLGASSFKEYCKVILRQFDIRSSSANAALEALRVLLPVLRTPVSRS